MNARLFVSLLLLISLAACERSDQELVPPKVDPTPDSASNEEDGPNLATPEAPEPTPQLPQSKEAVASVIIQPDRLQGYSVRLAYDLGSVKLAVVDRPGDPQALSLVRAEPPAAASTEDFVRAFAGEAFEGETHPLELLGYDLVQVNSHGVDTVGKIEIPWVSFGWMRHEVDSPIERGSGSAHWLRCPDDVTVLLVGGDSAGAGKYGSEKTRAFALAALPCGPTVEKPSE